MNLDFESSPLFLFALGAALAAMLALLLYVVFAKSRSWAESDKYKQDYFTAKANLESAQSNVATLRAQVTALVDERERLTADLDTHKKARVTMESRLDVLLADHLNARAQREASANAIQTTQNELQRAEAARAEAEHAGQEVSARARALEDELKHKDAALEEAQRAKTELEAKLEEMGQARVAMKVELDALGARALETNFALDALENAQIALKQKEEEIAAHSQKHITAQHELEDTRKAGAELEARIRELSENATHAQTLSAELTALKTELEKEKRINGEVQSEYQKLVDELAEARQRNQESHAQLVALKSQFDENQTVQVAASNQLKASMDEMLADRLKAEKAAAEAQTELEKVRTSTAARMAVLMTEANSMNLAMKRKDTEIQALQKQLSSAALPALVDEAAPEETPEPLAWQPQPEPHLAADEAAPVKNPSPAPQPEQKIAPATPPATPVSETPLPAGETHVTKPPVLPPTEDEDEPEIAPRPRAPRARLAKPRSILSGLQREAACPQYLSEVRGIGEAYEKKLYAAGIGTYWELAHTTDGELERIFDPRDFRNVNCQVIRDDAMRLAIETASLGREWDGSAPDPLTDIPGLGRAFEKSLFDAGICTFYDLADLSPARLEEICGKGAVKRPNFAEWIAEAAARC